MIGSTIAAQALALIVGMASVGYYAVYALTILAAILAARRGLLNAKSSFDLGSAAQLIRGIALVWSILVIGILTIPTANNQTALTAGGFFVLAALWYVFVLPRPAPARRGRRSRRGAERRRPAASSPRAASPPSRRGPRLARDPRRRPSSKTARPHRPRSGGHAGPDRSEEIDERHPDRAIPAARASRRPRRTTPVTTTSPGAIASSIG